MALLSPSFLLRSPFPGGSLTLFGLDPPSPCLAVHPIYRTPIYRILMADKGHKGAKQEAAPQKVSCVVVCPGTVAFCCLSNVVSVLFTAGGTTTPARCRAADSRALRQAVSGRATAGKGRLRRGVPGTVVCCLVNVVLTTPHQVSVYKDPGKKFAMKVELKAVNGKASSKLRLKVQ